MDNARTPQTEPAERVVSLSRLRALADTMRDVAAEQAFTIGRQAKLQAQFADLTIPDKFGMTARGWENVCEFFYALGGQIQQLRVDQDFCVPPTKWPPE